MNLLLTLLLTLFFQQSKVMICISNTAHSYHKFKCKGLNRCSHEVRTITEEYAKKLGKDPCDFCYGPEGSQQPIIRSTASSQCNGITKKNLQCRNKAKANGYCHLHGGY